MAREKKKAVAARMSDIEAAPAAESIAAAAPATHRCGDREG